MPAQVGNQMHLNVVGSRLRGNDEVLFLERPFVIHFCGEIGNHDL